jgi:hypothetical protein
MDYILLLEFVRWCEENEKTEWMGYNGMAEKVIGQFLEYKYSNKEQSK